MKGKVNEDIVRHVFVKRRESVPVAIRKAVPARPESGFRRFETELWGSTDRCVVQIWTVI